MSEEGLGCDDFTSAVDRERRRRYRDWALVAAMGYIGAAVALRWRVHLPVWLPWVTVALAAVLFLQATRSYVEFLRHADELLRKIETDALAAAFGVGLLLSLLSPLVWKLGAPELDVSGLGLAMAVTWGVAGQLGRRRYRGESD